MPSKNVLNSIPFILSSFFKNDEKVVLSSNDTLECYYSENIPKYIKDKINQIGFEKNGLVNEDKNTVVKEYLNSLT